jgi:nitrate/TMAO reductase-like tetraheme cytochrome c subunit
MQTPETASTVSSETAVPKPHGWIGTADDWSRGLGIAFCLFALVALFVARRRVRRNGLDGRIKEFLVLPMAVLPLIIVFLGFSYGLESTKTVASCGSCHVMEPYVANLRDPGSDALAAMHFKNRYIQQDHCYTCHADYGMFGSMSAKLDGVRHVLHNTLGSYPTPLKIARPYPNARCLGCHGESQAFLKSEGHPQEDRPSLFRGEVSCLDCHGPAHSVAAQQVSQ